MKKLYFVLPTLNIGGIERVSIDLMKYLKDFYEVHLVVLNLNGESFDLPNDIVLHNLKISRARYSFKVLKRFFKQHRNNIVISPVTYTTIILSFYKKYIYKLISIEHGLVSCRFDDTKNIFYRNIYFILLKNSLRKIDRFIFVSKSVQDDWKKYLKYDFNKSEIIYNLVDFDHIDNMKLHKCDINLKINKFRFLSVGRLSLEKNINLSLKVVSLFKKTNSSDFEYIIVGDGPEKLNIMNFISVHDLEQSVYLCGFDRNPYKYMNCSDVMILTSYHEALPTVIIESLYLGMKVIGTYPLGGIKDIVNGADGVFLTYEYDAKYILANLETAIEYSHDADKNRSLMRERFGKDVILKKYINILED